ncbi:receptor-type tyrosine-protein phosphatase V-like [Pteropus vampyrus]|uniref:protein-tyrosine-phosphatase n=1 Tax=Pteropus vampyrus TaxID=132908 RepID=A0A6P6CT12_PTEVA|nr:receptor-type tyrosine-protein phosphatase V-like [Pteropus vampyrus]
MPVPHRLSFPDTVDARWWRGLPRHLIPAVGTQPCKAMGQEAGPPPPRRPEPGEGPLVLGPSLSSRALPAPPPRCPGRAYPPSCTLAAQHARVQCATRTRSAAGTHTAWPSRCCPSPCCPPRACRGTEATPPSNPPGRGRESGNPGLPSYPAPLLPGDCPLQRGGCPRPGFSRERGVTGRQRESLDWLTLGARTLTVPTLLGLLVGCLQAGAVRSSGGLKGPLGRSHPVSHGGALRGEQLALGWGERSLESFADTAAMRPPVLCAALLWLRAFLAKEDCGAGHLDGASGGPPLTVHISGQGKPGSLSLGWTAPGLGRSSHVRLTRLGPLGSPEGPQLQALTNASSFEFQGLEPGSAHRLEVTALWPCGQNATVVLTAHAAPSTVRDLQLRSPGHPSGLQASWGAAPGQQGGHRLLLYHLESQTLARNVSVPPDALSYNFSGLLAGSEYVLEVATWAGHLQAKTSVHQWTDPGPPGQLVLRALGPSALQASWNGSEGAAWLHLMLRDLLGGANLTAAVRRGVSSHTFRHLSPGTPYELMLSAAAGPHQAAGPRAMEWTLPAPPSDLSLSPVAQSPALRASWTPPPGGRDGFQLQLYRLRPLSLESTGTLAPEARNFSWASLPPGTEFRLLLVTLRGPDQSRSANASAWTPPVAPRLLNVTSEGPTWLRASWVHAPGGRDGYQVTLYQAGARAAASTVGAEVDSASFSALTPGTRYEVLVLRDLPPGRNLSLTVLCRAGPLQASTHPVVLPVEPGPVQDVQCQPKATRLGLSWTVPTGDVGTCAVLVEHLELGGSARRVFEASASGGALQLPGLLPATRYRLSLRVLGSNGLWSRTVTLVCATSADAWRPPELAAAPQLAPRPQMGVVLTRGLFGEDDGQIQWYGVIASTNASLARPPREAVNRTWHDHFYGGHDSYLATLLPSPFHPGPWATPGAWAVPVGTEDCGQAREICNGQLKPGSQYRFSIVAFTRLGPPETTFSFSAFSEPRTCVSQRAAPLPVAVAVGAAAGCVLAACAALGLLHWRRARGQRTEKNRFSPETTVHSLRPGRQTFVTQLQERPLLSTPQPASSSPSFSLTTSGSSSGSEWAGPGAPGPGQACPEGQGSPPHCGEAGVCVDEQACPISQELKEVGKEQPRLEAEHPANASKNRYPHVLPYDHSRVRLAQLQGDPHSDYVNASFVPGYTHPQEFIATQGPLKKTLGDFWRLVWEQQVRIIVMLTVGMENGRVSTPALSGEAARWHPSSSRGRPGNQAGGRLAGVKSARPEAKTTQEPGGRARKFPDPGGGRATTPQAGHSDGGGVMLTLRIGSRKSGGWARAPGVRRPSACTPQTVQPQRRRVKQLQFTTWADHSVPEGPGSLLAFADLVREQARATQGPGPILVHCSAGVGRSGTFVALVRLLQQLEEEQAVDVFNAVCALRLHRPLMIQTPSQYIFLHSCLLSKILEGPSASSRAGRTGGGSWRTPSAPSPVRPGPRPQRIAVTDFAQACAERAVNANAGFLVEHQLLLQAISAAGSVPPPPGCKQDSTASYDRSTAWLSLEDEGSPPDEMPRAWLFPGGPSGHDHVVLMGPARPQELWQLVWEHQAQVLISLCPSDTHDEDCWPTELQPIVTGPVTARWEAESDAAGWPCTLLRVTQVGGGHGQWDVQGRVRACSGSDATALSPGGQREGEAGAEAAVSALGAGARAARLHPAAVPRCRGPVLLPGLGEAGLRVAELQLQLWPPGGANLSPSGRWQPLTVPQPGQRGDPGSRIEVVPGPETR